LLPTVEGVDGSLVYISECGPCHGVSRQGLLGPALDRDMSIVFLSAWLPVHKTGVDMDPRLRNVLINWLYTNSGPSNRAEATSPFYIFVYNCATCHGVERQGGDGGPAVVPDNISNFDSDYLASFLRQHYSGQTLTVYQRNIVADWLLVTPPIPHMFSGPEDLYDSYCSVCHGTSRQGSAGGSDIRPPQLTNYEMDTLTYFVDGHFPGLMTFQRNSLAGWLLETP
jgi:mono/diheme cytochrome c family protein